MSAIQTFGVLNAAIKLPAISYALWPSMDSKEKLVVSRWRKHADQLIFLVNLDPGQGSRTDPPHRHDASLRRLHLHGLSGHGMVCCHQISSVIIRGRPQSLYPIHTRKQSIPQNLLVMPPRVSRMPSFTGFWRPLVASNRPGDPGPTHPTLNTNDGVTNG